ncbi:MAG: 50S ribosomal protein L3 N(5)-glutamine methyltransferase [Betaproteobacteria bacterium]|nr:50S ribosomal protein L3 N(5)-glutamine methyltransferase [Betaproteobacteria bacterium]
MKISQLIDRCAHTLELSQVSFGHGTTNAEDEAAWLVLWQLGMPLDIDFNGDHTNRVVTQEEYRQVQDLIQLRIRTRKPAAYLTQEAWLQGVSFYVDERTIVPRSLIAEVLAESIIDPWLSPDTHRVLDLCTGNGSLGILAALAFPDVSVQGLDIAADALAVAQINIERYGLQHRMSLTQSDGLENAIGEFDLILCNPPYVNSISMSQLPAEFQAEPALALAGGEDGMDFVRKLLAQVTKHMSAHAVLVIEIGHERKHFEAAFPHLEVVWLTTSAGDSHVMLVTRSALAANHLSA